MVQKASIGMDIGGTKTLLALFDEKFRVVDEIKFKTRPQKGEKAFSRNLRQSTRMLLAKAKSKNLALSAIGIGCAGAMDYKRGAVKECLNVPFLEGYKFSAVLGKLTKANIVVGNDVHAGLYGEHQLGAAVGASHVIAVFIGTGLGGGLIIDGKLHLGAGGAAGNIGNYLLNTTGPLSGSQREGVLDDLASRGAIAGDAARFAAKQWAPSLFKHAGTDVNKITSGDLAAAIKAGDEVIEDLVRSRARLLGIALSNLIDFVDPDVVVLGGGLVEAMPDLMRKEVRRGIKNHTPNKTFKNLKVAVAKLGNHAVTAGAAKFAVDMSASGEGHDRDR